jgi:hypothetical protein
MFTPKDEEAKLQAIAKMLDVSSADCVREVHRVSMLRKPFSAPDAPRFVPSRQKAEADRMNELEAAGHFLKLLQATMPEPGERKILSVLRHEFTRMSFSAQDFQEGLEQAIESGWVTQAGMMVELTKAGRNAVV